jgi:hypothetical protein
MSIIPFEIESAKFVGDWNYVAINTICTICNESLYKSAPVNKQVNYFNYSISMGDCKHAFHHKCIKKFHRNDKRCPEIDCHNKLFKYSCELENKGTIKLFKH